MQEKSDIQIRAVSRLAISETGHKAPLGDSMIPAGFPSPADDCYESLDIVSHIVKHPAATFFMRVAGDSMTGAGIFDGDLVIVDITSIGVVACPLHCPIMHGRLYGLSEKVLYFPVFIAYFRY